MTNRIETIKSQLSHLSAVTPVSDADLQTFKFELPGIPSDYIDFLSQVGHGEVGSIRIYSGPISPSDIYPKPQSDLSGIVLFGDDYQGYCFGFDTRTNYTLVEVDPRGTFRPLKEDGFLSLVMSHVSE